MKKIYIITTLLMLSMASLAQPCNYTYTMMQPNQIEFYPPLTYAGSQYYFRWDFGDGSSIVADTTLHTFITQGNQTVTLNVHETSTGNVICTSSQVLNLIFCDYHYDQDTITKSTFTFYAGSLNGNTAEWNFGDGNIATGDTVTHTFQNPGTYTVGLTQFDATMTIVCVTSFMVAYNPASICGFDVVVPNPVLNSMYFVLNALVPSSSGTVTWNYGVPGIPDGNGYWTGVGYGDTGVYNVCMTYVGNNGYTCQSCMPLVAQRNCDFAAFADSTNSSLYFFDAYNATSGTQFQWDFGDGSIIIAGDTISHFFAQPGFYNVCMNVVDTATNSILCSYCMPIAINGNPFNCQADFSSVSVGLNAYFIDQSTAIVPNQVNYLWSFGDGLLSSQRFPQHQYAMPGTYNVCLSINSFGCSSSTCQQVVIDTAIVNPVGCNALFIFTQTANFQVAAVNLSSGTNLTFNWDFGDGAVATGPYPTHQYSSTGSYNVCLTVNDANGCTDTYCDSLTVDANGNILYRGSSIGFVLNVLSPIDITAVKNLDRKSSLIITPNPAHDFIDIELKLSDNSTCRFEIINSTGSIVSQGFITNGRNKINVNELASSMYLFRIIDADGKATHKTFIKQ